MDQVRELIDRNLFVTPAQIESHYNKELLLPFVLIDNLTHLEYVTKKNSDKRSQMESR
jgi:hypothetical protein